MEIRKKITLLFLLSALFFGWLPAEARATTRFYMEPDSGSYNNGDEFTVAVWVDPAGKDVQAMDMIINFDKSRLDVDKSKIVDENYFDYGSSVFNVDNVTGQMKLYVFSSQGSYSKNTKGKVVTVTFRAKAEGTAALNFVCDTAADTGGSAIRNVNEDNFIDCSANGSGSYTISGSSGSDPTPTPTPTISDSSSPTPTPSQLPDTGFSLAGWSIISLGGVLLSAGLMALVL